MAKRIRKFPDKVGVVLQLDKLGRTQGGTIFTPKSMNRYPRESMAFLSGADKVLYVENSKFTDEEDRRVLVRRYRKVSDRVEIDNSLKVTSRYIEYRVMGSC